MFAVKDEIPYRVRENLGFDSLALTFLLNRAGSLGSSWPSPSIYPKRYPVRAVIFGRWDTKICRFTGIRTGANCLFVTWSGALTILDQQKETWISFYVCLKPSVLFVSSSVFEVKDTSSHPIPSDSLSQEERGSSFAGLPQLKPSPHQMPGRGGLSAWSFDCRAPR